MSVREYISYHSDYVLAQGCQAALDLWLSGLDVAVAHRAGSGPLG